MKLVRFYGAWDTDTMALSTNDRNWIEDQFLNLRELIVQNQIDIAVLKTKAGIYGLIGGALSVLISIGVYLLVQ